MTRSFWPDFTLEELTCRCGCGQALMDPAFMEKLEALRRQLGFPLPVTSGYRCPAHNLAVADSGADGPHTTGKAVDIGVSRVRATQLVAAALAAGFAGVGVKQHGPESGRMVHLDMTDRPEQILWTY